MAWSTSCWSSETENEPERVRNTPLANCICGNIVPITPQMSWQRMLMDRHFSSEKRTFLIFMFLYFWRLISWTNFASNLTHHIMLESSWKYQKEYWKISECDSSILFRCSEHFTSQQMKPALSHGGNGFFTCKRRRHRCTSPMLSRPKQSTWWRNSHSCQGRYVWVSTTWRGFLLREIRLRVEEKLC